MHIYDWASFFGGHFSSVQHLKSYHHFHFPYTQSGVVVMKEFTGSVEKSYTMVVDDEWSTELPQVILSHLASPSPGSGICSHRSGSTVDLEQRTLHAQSH